MKAIPKELQAYFPKVINADRPWWNREDLPMGFCVGPQWSRPDGYETTDIDDRESIDKANPLPPPPILVGQVWAVLGPDNATIVVFTILSVITQPGKPLTARGTERTWFDTQLWGSGFLLSCPYGYAPWSGPEVI